MLLSRNYRPSADLEAYIARHHVFSAASPDGIALVDHLMSETAFIRVVLRGDWSGELDPNRWTRPGRTLFFGSNSRPLKVRLRGPLHVVGVALRPCGWRDLFDRPASELADSMLRLSDVWGAAAEERFSRIDDEADDGAIVAACEAAMRARLTNGRVSNPMRDFESIARVDSTTRVVDVADRLGLSTRQFERLSLAHFGHQPKLVLRRSRFLDLATVLRGLGDPTDETLAALRYFDQSHTSREFKRFIGMTPAEFEKTPTPLLNAGLKWRQERKHEPPLIA